MQCVHHLSTSGMKDSGMEENQRRTDSRDGPPWVVKMTMKDITFLIRLAKTLTRHDV